MNESIKSAFYIVIFGVLCAIAGYMLGIRDNGTSADEVRVELNNAQEQQQQITTGIAHAEGTVQDAGRIVEECQSILRAVRSQPASKAEKGKS